MWSVQLYIIKKANIYWLCFNAELKIVRLSIWLLGYPLLLDCRIWWMSSGHLTPYELAWEFHVTLGDLEEYIIAGFNIKGSDLNNLAGGIWWFWQSFDYLLFIEIRQSWSFPHCMLDLLVVVLFFWHCRWSWIPFHISVLLIKKFSGY